MRAYYYETDGMYWDFHHKKWVSDMRDSCISLDTEDAARGRMYMKVLVSETELRAKWKDEIVRHKGMNMNNKQLSRGLVMALHWAIQDLYDAAYGDPAS